MAEAVLKLGGNTLRFLLAGGKAFVNAPELLADLDPEAAVSRLAGAQHSIAEVVAHLDYWQGWFIAGARGDALAYPEHNDDTFPKVEPGDWAALREHFLQGLEQIKALCDDEALLNRAFTHDLTPRGGHEGRTVGTTMLYTVALHNGHHYGQIITLRQLMGLWPPQAGGVSW